jgi:hypothetical protein
VGGEEESWIVSHLQMQGGPGLEYRFDEMQLKSEEHSGRPNKTGFK